MSRIIDVLKELFDKYKIYLLNVSLYFLPSVFSAIISILLNPLLAKNLSYNDYAIIGYFNSFNILFLPMLSFSLVSYYLRNYQIISDDKKELFTNTITISLIGISILSSVLVLFAFYVFFIVNNVALPFWPFSIFIVFQIVFSNFLILLQAQYRIKREAKKFAILSIVRTIVWLIITVLLVVILKYGAFGNLGANFFVSFLIGIYCVKFLITKIEFDFNIFKDALKFCWPLTLSAILWYFLSDIDRVFLEKLNDTESLALYNIGITISGFLSMFYTAISQTFEPDIYKSILDENYSKLKKIIIIIIVINAIPVILFMIMALPITDFLTSGRYNNAAGFAQILSLKNISTSFYYSVISVIIGLGYTKSELGLRAVGAVICIFMYKFLINHFGFYGAAWGQSISFMIMAIIGLTYIYYLFKNNFIKKII